MASHVSNYKSHSDPIYESSSEYDESDYIYSVLSEDEQRPYYYQTPQQMNTHTQYPHINLSELDQHTHTLLNEFFTNFNEDSAYQQWLEWGTIELQSIFIERSIRISLDKSELQREKFVCMIRNWIIEQKFNKMCVVIGIEKWINKLDDIILDIPFVGTELYKITHTLFNKSEFDLSQRLPQQLLELISDKEELQLLMKFKSELRSNLLNNLIPLHSLGGELFRRFPIKFTHEFIRLCIIESFDKDDHKRLEITQFIKEWVEEHKSWDDLNLAIIRLLHTLEDVHYDNVYVVDYTSQLLIEFVMDNLIAHNLLYDFVYLHMGDDYGKLAVHNTLKSLPHTFIPMVDDLWDTHNTPLFIVRDAVEDVTHTFFSQESHTLILHHLQSFKLDYEQTKFVLLSLIRLTIWRSFTLTFSEEFYFNKIIKLFKFLYQKYQITHKQIYEAFTEAYTHILHDELPIIRARASYNRLLNLASKFDIVQSPLKLF